VVPNDLFRDTIELPRLPYQTHRKKLASLRSKLDPDIAMLRRKTRYRKLTGVKRVKKVGNASQIKNGLPIGEDRSQQLRVASNVYRLVARQSPFETRIRPRNACALELIQLTWIASLNGGLSR
jgi:hypothetical protein